MHNNITSIPEQHKGHRQRIRRKIIKSGLAGFNDYEIIEYFLMLSIPVKDVKPLAKKLVKEFGSISGVLDAPKEALSAVQGIGEVTISSIIFFRSLLEHYLKEKAQDTAWLPSTKHTQEFLNACFKGLKIEIFKVIFLNNRNHMISERTVHTGTVDRSAVYPREIIYEAMKIGSTRLIIAHNHPSGGLEPSDADKKITHDLVCAAVPLGIEVLDHIVISNTNYFSFAEAGLMEKYYQSCESKKDICIT
ncbi:MAG: DNA repair protein RadC [bacterium]